MSRFEIYLFKNDLEHIIIRPSLALWFDLGQCDSV